MPVIVAVTVLAREAVVALLALVTTRRGERLVVTWEGKTAAFLLMFAFPLFLGANSELSYAGILGPLAWLCVIPALGYGWYSALFQYLPASRRTIGAPEA